MTQRMPKSSNAQGACSRLEPQPKLSPAISTSALRYAGLLSTKSGVHEIHLEMLADIAECHVACGRYGEAVSVYRKILVDDPCRESIHRALMEYLVRLGHIDSAVAQYRHCQRVLARELDVEPMAETQRLYRQINAGEAGAATEKAVRIAE